MKLKTRLVWITSLFVTQLLYGQIPGKINDGPITLFDTLTVKKGYILHLGKGSDPISGDFKYIYRPQNKVLPVIGEVVMEEFTEDDIELATIQKRALDKGFSGKSLVVKNFSEISSKKNGKRILGVIEMGGYAFDGGTIAVGNLVVDFEPAIKSGEIVTIMEPDEAGKPSTNLKWTQFEITRNGIEPVIMAIDYLSKNDIYVKTVDWSNSFYKTPNEATITSVPDEKVKINGMAKNVKVAKMMGVDMYGDLSYLLVTDITEGQIRLSFTLGDEKGNVLDDVTFADIFDKKGEVYKPYKDFKLEIEKLMNDLSYALVEYILK